VLNPLESRFPPWDQRQSTPDGIIVLGGSTEPDLSAAHGVANATSDEFKLPQNAQRRLAEYDR
jgi:hypothetical protein